LGFGFTPIKSLLRDFTFGFHFVLAVISTTMVQTIKAGKFRPQEKDMQTTDRLSSYLALLKIRQKTTHRNMLIGGGLFVIALLATTATLLLTEWNERSIWLMGMFDVLFVVNFLMAWARWEITKEKIELVHNLQIQ
jgi:hypothetical protein